MTTSCLQANAASIAGVTSSTTSYTSPVSSGSLLVAYFSGSQVTGRTLTVSDSINGSWNQDIAGNTQASVGIFSFPNTAAGSPTITYTISGAAATLRILIEEWSQVLTSAPKDQTAVKSSPNVTSVTNNATGTLAIPQELVVTCNAVNIATVTNHIVSAPFTQSPANLVQNFQLLQAGYLLPNNTAGVASTFTWTTLSNSQVLTASYQLQVIVPDTLLGQGWV